ncbi:8436_t:CDS:2 [Racocetra persica]|uniref:8436_t:CDS:1 n=1 Tax=Racocetra persica TaxID=160502 RepID=A0ACA9LD89_9GLOM|nr:8436_t:CDS:2 [Racocetra persica]
MVARIHDTFYDAKATLLSEANIKKIRESRGKIPNASKKMADKFHIGPKHVYEIWDNKECLQQELENKICNVRVEPSKSTDSTPEESKVKKSGGKKSKPKNELAPLILSTIQSQPVNLKSSDINKEKLHALYEEMIERSNKNLANMKV